MKTTLALAAPWLVLGVLLLLGGSPAPRQASEISSTLQPAAQIGFLGEIRLSAGNFTPPTGCLAHPRERLR